METELNEAWWEEKKGEPLTFPERLQVEQILQTIRLMRLFEKEVKSPPPVVDSNVNTPSDPKGSFHMILPDMNVPGEWVMELLLFAASHGWFYDRGAIQSLPIGLRDHFEAGPPDGVARAHE